MSPVERVVPLSELAKIRVECGKCHTTIAFPISGHKAGNIGEHCPYCREPWELVERTVIVLWKTLDQAKGIKSHIVSFETEEAF